MFLIKLMVLIFFLFNFTISFDRSCYCNSSLCPKYNINYLTMGGGNAKLNYTYINHNNYNVVINVSGIINVNSLDKGSGTTDCVQKYARSLDDNEEKCDAGHILAKRLGGYGNLPINIFPQNSTINRGIYAQFEKKIYKYIKKKNIFAKLVWKFYYKNNKKTMPYLINYSVFFEDGYNLSSMFNNK